MSLIRRRMMMQQQDDGEYVTSIDGVRIKVLQVIPKEYDPDGKSIRDEIYEENGKRYLKKQVRDGITGVMPITTPASSVVTFVPSIRWRKSTSCIYVHTSYYKFTTMWIDGTEVTSKGTNELYLEKKSIGISYAVGDNTRFRYMNPNNLSAEEIQELISNKPFRYAVPEEEVEIIEIR